MSHFIRPMTRDEIADDVLITQWRRRRFLFGYLGCWAAARRKDKSDG